MIWFGDGGHTHGGIIVHPSKNTYRAPSTEYREGAFRVINYKLGQGIRNKKESSGGIPLYDG